MEYRIKKYTSGWVVEVQKTKGIFKRKYWTHFISVSGINSMPWFYKNYKGAEMGLIDELKHRTFDNSIDCNNIEELRKEINGNI